jgi:transglutaminase-like putative cysteine protease
MRGRTDSILVTSAYWISACGLVGLMVLLSCSGGLNTLGGQDRVFADVEFWSEADSLFGEYGGGWWLREKTSSLRLEGGNWYASEEHHYQLVVLDAEDMRDYADVSIPFGAGTRISDIKARTIKSTGEILPVESDDIFEKSRVPGFMLYADTKEKVFAMPGFSDYCVLDVSYYLEREAFYLIDEFDLADFLPVHRAKFAYSIDSRIYAAGYKVYCKSYNSSTEPEQTDFETPYGKMITWTWVFDDLPACPNEQWMPPREKFIPRIALAGFAPGQERDDWSYFTRYYSRLLPSFDEPEAAVAGLAEDVTSSANGDREAIQSVMDYVGSNFRYVAVGLEETGWKPNPMRDVLRNKCGDCKDLSCLVVSMLRSVGIEAYPALVLTADQGLSDRGLVLPRFNHMIVYARTSDGDIWLDPTAAPFPLGYLPPPVRNIEALVVQGEDPFWQRTPEIAAFPALRTSRTAVSISPAGAIEGRSRVSYRGDFGQLYAGQFVGKRDMDLPEAIESDLAPHFPNAALEACELAGSQASPPLVALSARFTKPSAGIVIDQKMAFKLDFAVPIAWQLADLPRAGGRRFPLSFPHTWTEVDTIVVRIPDGWEVHQLPVDLRVGNRFGSCSLTCSEGVGECVIVRKHQLNVDAVDGQEYEDFVEFWANARNLMSKEVVLRRM